MCSLAACKNKNNLVALTIVTLQNKKFLLNYSHAVHYQIENLCLLLGFGGGGSLLDNCSAPPMSWWRV